VAFQISVRTLINDIGKAFKFEGNEHWHELPLRSVQFLSLPR
jgi:hypothetical protein